MDKDAYIKQLETENAELKKRVEKLEKHIEELERFLGTNSKNLSKQSSSVPLGISAVQPKGVDWQFTTTDARIKLKRLYPQVQS